MQLCDDLTELRKQTITWWQTRTHATHGDIDRVYAFRALDPETATDDDVTRAYGGPGWANVDPCQECGAGGDRVRIGGVVLCSACVRKAFDLLHPPAETPAPRAGFFSRLLKG